VSARTASAALVCSLAGVCAAETAPSEAVSAGVNAQRMPSAGGGSASVDWVQVSERRVVTAGASVANVGASQWTLIKGSLARNREKGLSWFGGLDVGPGSNGGERFTFFKAGFGVSAPLGARWRVSAEGTHVDVEPVTGDVVTLAGETNRASGLGLRLQTSSSVSGTLDERGYVVRLDYRAKAPYLMGGFATTRTNNRLSLGASATDSSALRVHQAFVGVSFPLRRTALTVAFEHGKAGTARRTGVSVVVKVPLESTD